MFVIRQVLPIYLDCLCFTCSLSCVGVEALTFVATVYLLHGAKRTKTLVLKFAFVILMFMFNTIVSFSFPNFHPPLNLLQHIGAVFRRTLNAFVGTPDDPVPDASAYLADLAGFLYRFMNIIIVVQFIMLDILVVCGFCIV